MLQKTYLSVKLTELFADEVMDALCAERVTACGHTQSSLGRFVEADRAGEGPLLLLLLLPLGVGCRRAGLGRMRGRRLGLLRGDNQLLLLGGLVAEGVERRCGGGQEGLILCRPK